MMASNKPNPRWVPADWRVEAAVAEAEARRREQERCADEAFRIARQPSKTVRKYLRRQFEWQRRQTL
jgi:hypothetical protein